LFCNVVFAQQIIFSETHREDSRDMNFDIIGRMKGNIIIFKNVRGKYAVNVYDDSMIMKDKVELDFLPGRVFNVDYVAYPEFFYLIYQHQKKGVVYCMAVKMGADGKKINDPIELDTTQVGTMGDNKIYSTIYSEDKKKIMIFKIQKKNDQFHFVTLLYDRQLNLLRKSRQDMGYDEEKSNFSEFYIDNEGNFLFTVSTKTNNRESFSSLTLYFKKALEDTYIPRRVNLKNTFIDEVKIKIDNVNKRYIINTFYYPEKYGQIDGIFLSIFDVVKDSTVATIFTRFDEDLRSVAKSSGNSKFAFNDFFIRNILLKKDGSFILHAEDYSSQTTGFNNWNRNDFLFNNPYMSPFNYYNFNPIGGGFYRPFNSFGNRQNTRYYYENILLISISKTGLPEWSNIIHKQQYSDDNDNFLSYNTFNTGGEIHFLFNDISRRDKLLSNYIINPDGTSKRSPTLRTYEKGYEFMPRFAKQIGARQVIIPCTLHGEICFAKVDF
jgi:hypothetical protein